MKKKTVNLIAALLATVMLMCGLAAVTSAYADAGSNAPAVHETCGAEAFENGL